MIAQSLHDLPYLAASHSGPALTVLPVDGWWKADIIGGVDGASVSAWADSSGNGFTMTQSNGALQPILKLNILNGKSVVRIPNSAGNGVGLFISGTSINVGANYTIFAVYDKNTDGSGGQRMLQSTSNNWLIGPYSDSCQFYNGGFASSPPGMTTGVFVYQTVWCDGANGHNRVNGTEVGTTGTAGQTPANLAISGAGAFPTNTALGDIAEAIVYKRTLNSTDIASVEAYLKAKWGL